ncbi:IclR family transcriptional regulator [Leucobacter allii]|uniref:IclR family transcriptional regulator n=1 Tax=Leucobacter allii TaxID=2932247 RepID=UPI001FD56FE0|nr:IclR family transcriptional regulator [Leucobacter allii]UOR00887.1 IclR family transcriptional regulator [Leucobacter allii]
MLERGLVILGALGEHPDGMVLTDIVKATGLPVSTTHRLLNIVVTTGFAAFDSATKRYTLGVRIFELASRVRSVQTISQIARPLMRELADLTGETIQLAVLADGSAMFLEKVGADRSITIRGTVGQREPLWATSTGKVLLAALEPEELETTLAGLELRAYTEHTITSRERLLETIAQVAEQDWALTDEEYDRDVRAIAVPVRNSDDRVAAALCIAGPKYRLDVGTLEGWLPELRETAHRIGVQLAP